MQQTPDISPRTTTVSPGDRTKLSFNLQVPRTMTDGSLLVGLIDGEGLDTIRDNVRRVASEITPLSRNQIHAGGSSLQFVTDAFAKAIYNTADELCGGDPTRLYSPRKVWPPLPRHPAGNCYTFTVPNPIEEGELEIELQDVWASFSLPQGLNSSQHGPLVRLDYPASLWSEHAGDKLIPPESQLMDAIGKTVCHAAGSGWNANDEQPSDRILATVEGMMQTWASTGQLAQAAGYLPSGYSFRARCHPCAWFTENEQPESPPLVKPVIPSSLTVSITPGTENAEIVYYTTRRFLTCPGEDVSEEASGDFEPKSLILSEEEAQERARKLSREYHMINKATFDSGAFSISLSREHVKETLDYLLQLEDVWEEPAGFTSYEGNSLVVGLSLPRTVSRLETQAMNVGQVSMTRPSRITLKVVYDDEEGTIKGEEGVN